MRIAIAILMLAAATPAAAQDAMLLHYMGQAQVEQEAARQRDVALRNELMVLDARIRTDQALRDIEAQRTPLSLPRDGQTPSAAPSTQAGYAAIPDDKLAASNARVRAAAQRR